MCAVQLHLAQQEVTILHPKAVTNLEDDVLGAGPLAHATSQLHTNHLDRGTSSHTATVQTSAAAAVNPPSFCVTVQT